VEILPIPRKTGIWFENVFGQIELRHEGEVGRQLAVAPLICFNTALQQAQEGRRFAKLPEAAAFLFGHEILGPRHVGFVDRRRLLRHEEVAQTKAPTFHADGPRLVHDRGQNCAHDLAVLALLNMTARLRRHRLPK
jgi:hypothetical protein